MEIVIMDFFITDVILNMFIIYVIPFLFINDDILFLFINDVILFLHKLWHPISFHKFSHPILSATYIGRKPCHAYVLHFFLLSNSKCRRFKFIYLLEWQKCIIFTIELEVILQSLQMVSEFFNKCWFLFIEISDSP